MIWSIISSWIAAVFAVRIIKGGTGGYLQHCLVATILSVAAPFLIDWLAYEPPLSWMLTAASALGAGFVGVVAADIIFGA